MLSYPNFPTQSAYGNMPAFPTIQIQIANPITLPKWVAQMVGYYGNVLNIPYTNPPKEPLISFPIPNILLIPLYILHLSLWILGWAGAIFEYLVVFSADALGNLIISGINLITGTFTNVLTYTKEQTTGLGIFSIPIEIFVAGIMLVLMIGLIFGIVKLGQTIVEAI